MRPGVASACVTVVLAACLAGCSMQRHREQVRQGFFTRGLHRNAFLKEWGIPSRTFTMPAAEPVLRPDPYGGTSWQRPVYEIWEYQAQATCLTFDGVRLVSWERDRTDCEPKPPQECRAEPAPPYPPRWRGRGEGGGTAQ